MTAATFDYCPECDGLGTIDGRECGVCFGDGAIINRADVSYGLRDRITDQGSRFVDHSGIHHDCARCRDESPLQVLEAARVRCYDDGYDGDPHGELLSAVEDFLAGKGVDE